MTKQKTYFEQVPVQVAKSALRLVPRPRGLSAKGNTWRRNSAAVRMRLRQRPRLWPFVPGRMQ